MRRSVSFEKLDMEFDADGALHQLRPPASHPTVEEFLDDHVSELGHDLIAYRNHVYRARIFSRATMLRPHVDRSLKPRGYRIDWSLDAPILPCPRVGARQPIRSSYAAARRIGPPCATSAQVAAH